MKVVLAIPANHNAVAQLWCKYYINYTGARFTEAPISVVIH